MREEVMYPVITLKPKEGNKLIFRILDKLRRLFLMRSWNNIKIVNKMNSIFEFPMRRYFRKLLSKIFNEIKMKMKNQVLLLLPSDNLKIERIGKK